MVDGAHTFGEGGDRRVVGDVDDLGGDARIVVGVGELAPVTAGDDDSRALRSCQQRDGAGDPAAAPDHHNRLVLQRGTHCRVPQPPLSESGMM